MAIANIISAIGNNSSVYPLIVRDCGIEVPTKVVLTYNQNKKESKEIAYLAARERFLDEYATSLVWLGGIPLIGKICDKIIKKFNLSPNVNIKLFKEDNFQGIDKNIEEFKNIAPDAVKDLINAKKNKNLYEKLLAGKFIASTSIPILFMGFILPKLIFASSARKRKELRNKNFNQISFLQKDKFIKSNSLTFTGKSWINKTANLTIQDKMAITDGGYAVGRVSTARNKNESYDLAFKMTGMMFLNFVAPKWIERGLNKLTGVKLDPIILSDKDFIEQIKNNTLKLPKSSSAEDIFKFIDNPANKNSLFIKYLNKLNKVKFMNNGIRDPRYYVDTIEISNLRDEIIRFAKKSTNTENFDKFIKKARFSKYMNILTNVALSSFLLAYCLPKAQFTFRKIITGSNLEPGLKDNTDNLV